MSTRPSIALSVLVIAGAREAAAFPVPPGVDCLTLPSLGKEVDGGYRARGLDLPLHDLIALRADTVLAALEAFAPDVLIVDKEPRGALGELDPALKHLRAAGRTRIVLGLRDILDDAETVQHEWRGNRNEQAIRDFYDAIWVYGHPAVYDLAREYRFVPELVAKLRYTGYFDRHLGSHLAPRDEDEDHLAERDGYKKGSRHPGQLMELNGERLALCMVGGGQDGGHLAEAFAETIFPAGWCGVILTGPFMPPEACRRLHHRAAARPNLHVLGFVTDADWLLSRAERVVAMGGYNTVYEILSFEKAALIVPRVTPRREQWIRTMRLRELGLLDVLHPDQVTPAALGEWLARHREAPRAHEKIDLNGLARLPRLLAELLEIPATRQPILTRRVSEEVRHGLRGGRPLANASG